MFGLPLFGFKRLLVEARRIANSLEVIALHFAKEDHRMWTPLSGKRALRGWASPEEPEVLHTADSEMAKLEQQEAERFRAVGFDGERY